MTNHWAESRLKALETTYKRNSSSKDVLGEALELCHEYGLDYPDWVTDEVSRLPKSDVFDPFNNHSQRLEKAYNAGNLGAIKDMVYWCNRYQQPLPKWAIPVLFETIDSVSMDNQPALKSWRKWFKEYRQNMIDYGVYELVLEAREHGSTWSDAYAIAAAIDSNKTEEDGGSKSNTIEKTYKRVNERKAANPMQYLILQTFLPISKTTPTNRNIWDFIEKTIKSGKPKVLKKSIR